MAAQRFTKTGIAFTATFLVGLFAAYFVTRQIQNRSVDPVLAAQPEPMDVPSSNQLLRSQIPKIDFTDVDAAVVAKLQSAQLAVIAEPASGAAWGRFGHVLLAHEFDDAAASAFAEAEVLDPRDARWPYLQARSLILINSGEAVPMLERSVAICGDAPDAPILKLIEVLIALNRLPDAESRLTPFLKARPENARANLAMGRLQLRQGDLTRAAEYARMAEGHPATSKSAHELLAQILLRQGNKAESRKHQQLAASLTESGWPDPFYDEVLSQRTGLKAILVRADKLFGKGDVDATIPLLRQAIREYPESDWAHVLLGRSLIRSRHLAEAEQVLNRAVQLAPQSVEAQFRLGVAIYLQKRHQEAADWFRKAIALKPDFTMAHYNLGYCLKDMNDVAGAIQSFESTVASDPNNYEAHAILGMLLANERRYDESRKHWQRAVELRPNDKQARQQLERLPKGSSSP